MQINSQLLNGCILVAVSLQTATSDFVLDALGQYFVLEDTHILHRLLRQAQCQNLVIALAQLNTNITRPHVRHTVCGKILDKCAK